MTAPGPVSRRRKHLPAVLLAASVAIALSGCIDLDQHLVVESADDASFTTKVAVETAVLMLAPEEVDVGEYCNAKTETNDDRLQVMEQRYMEGSMTVCETTVKGPLKAIARHISEGRTLLKDDAEAEPDFALALEPDGDNYRFAVNLSKPEILETEPVADEFGELAELVVAATLTGRSLDWSVTAPRIVSTTGQLSEDGKTAEFSVPLATFVGDEAQTFEFEVVFAPETGLRMWLNRLVDWTRALWEWFKGLFV